MSKGTKNEYRLLLWIRYRVSIVAVGLKKMSIDYDESAWAQYYK
uniref:Uncharacterized protein n=1 Tax=Pristionchus pacificus TaxID=54126 RepID=A0A2A6CTL8_PRIPA|eukprot:PDM81450.1 hypothetical protein PRIPAC_35326 [Pristionchus pacificus]